MNKKKKLKGKNVLFVGILKVAVFVIRILIKTSRIRNTEGTVDRGHIIYAILSVEVVIHR
jgi:hypothetical protein